VRVVDQDAVEIARRLAGPRRIGRNSQAEHRAVR
jgi:hypothetical protein